MEEKEALYESDFMRQVAGDIIRPGGIAITEKIVSLAELPEKACVLDVGCGSGMTMEYLKNRYQYLVTGIDPSPKLIARAWKRNAELKIMEGQGENLPFAADSFDGVISECSLSVVTGLELTLAEIRRVLRKKGKLMISDLYVRNDKTKKEVIKPMEDLRKGVMPIDNIMGIISNHNFKINFWQDCTEYLTNFFCQMIMNNYSEQDVWANVINCDAHHLSREVRYGYYLLIAEKN